MKQHEDKRRDAYYKRVYGISLEQYNGLLAKQRGRCGVCKRLATSFKSRLAVDHNHRSGEVRGLLCWSCNHRLIGRHTDFQLFAAAARYLKKGTGWFVPEKRPRKRRRRKSH